MQTGTAAIRGGTALVNRDELQARPAAKAYVLLRAVPGARRRLVETLLHQPGVVTVDEVEGPLDIVLVMQAPDRTRLARTLMKTLGSVETMYDGLEMLPTQRRRSRVSRADTGGPA